MVAESREFERVRGTWLGVFLKRPAGSRQAADLAWARELNLLRQADKSVPRVLRVLLSALAHTPPNVLRDPGDVRARPILVSQANTTVAVNAVAAAGYVLGPESIADLGRVLGRLVAEPWTVESTAIRDAVANAIAAVGTQEAFEALKAAVPKAQQQAQRELELLLLSMGRTRWSRSANVAGMEEMAVPKHGLDVAGTRELTSRHRTYRVTLHEHGSATADSLDDADVVEDEAAQRVLRTELRAIRTTYEKETARIEALLATERTWSAALWRQLYLDHPITRAVAARLVWRLTLDRAGEAEIRDRAEMAHKGGGSARVQPARVLDVIPDWSAPGLLRVVNARVESVPCPQDVESVRLWHPRDAAPEDLAAWRALLRQLPFAQPFQQIERDFVAGVPDPEKTEFDRLAGTVAVAASWEAELASLAWTAVAKNAKPGGTVSDREELIHRQFPEEKVTATATFTRLNAQPVPLGAAAASYAYASASASASAEAEAVPALVRFGTAWIHRTQDKGRTPLPLATLPARLCSEVERDLILLMTGPSDAVPSLPAGV